MSSVGKLRPKRVAQRMWFAWKIIPSRSTLTATCLSSLPVSLRNELPRFPRWDKRGSALDT